MSDNEDERRFYEQWCREEDEPSPYDLMLSDLNYIIDRLALIEEKLGIQSFDDEYDMVCGG